MTYPTIAPEHEADMEAKVAAIEANASLSDEEKEAQKAEIENTDASDHLANSYAGRLGRAIEPFTQWAGFNWQTNIALIGGVAAKEVVISTLGTAYSLGAVDADDDETLRDFVKNDPHWNAPNHANTRAFLVFTLLYSPCFVTLLVIKKESGKWRWTLWSRFFNLARAFAAAVVTRAILI